MAFKDKLMTALHDAVGYFNESGNPSSAVVKSAKDHDFNSDQTQRLIETFNTARTIYHYKSASDRTTTFPLADRDEVLTELFGKSEGAKQAEVADHDYSEYDVPVRNYQERTPAEGETKQASAEQGVEWGLTLDNSAREALQRIRVQRQVVKAAADEARVAGEKVIETIRKVAESFAYGDQSDRIARLVAGYMEDPELKDPMAKLAECIPEHRCPTPATLMAYQRQHVIDDRDLGLQVSMLKEAKSWMDVEAELLAVSGVMEKEADEFERTYAGLFSTEFQPIQSPADLIKKADTETVVKQKYPSTNLFGEPTEVERTSNSAPKNEEQSIARMISDSSFDSAKPAVQKFLETGVERAFTQPRMEANKALSERMKNVQRQIMLQDLMVNDPVLSNETPDTVADAYNSLLQMAPEVSTNKEVVRAILRQSVHSVAVSPYDAEMWTKLEGNLRNIRGKGAPMAQQGGGKR